MSNSCSHKAITVKDFYLKIKKKLKKNVNQPGRSLKVVLAANEN